MKKIIVNKELLRDYRTLLVVLENCDVYEIGVDDILDIHCVAELINRDGNEYRTNDGFIKIASSASLTIERTVSRNNEVGTEFDLRLKERLEMCDGVADMTSFSLRDDKKRDIDIYVPYNPLYGVLYGSEIELTNCPSFEVDNEGDMIIAFGESSKQAKRKDNNYAELIEGWKDFFGDFEPSVLKVDANSLLTFGDAKTNLSFYFKVCDKNSKKSFAEIVFIDCKNISVEMYFPQKINCEIVMSKMEDGYIYVGIDGLGVEFICASVLEYDYYCNKNKHQRVFLK